MKTCNIATILFFIFDCTYAFVPSKINYKKSIKTYMNLNMYNPKDRTASSKTYAEYIARRDGLPTIVKDVTEENLQNNKDNTASSETYAEYIARRDGIKLTVQDVTSEKLENNTIGTETYAEYIAMRDRLPTNVKDVTKNNVYITKDYVSEINNLKNITEYRNIVENSIYDPKDRTASKETYSEYIYRINRNRHR